MSKSQNKRGKPSHGKNFTKESDRGKHWKHGKSSGKGTK